MLCLLVIPAKAGIQFYIPAHRAITMDYSPRPRPPFDHLLRKCSLWHP
jgi:hypothetical protein